MATLARDVGTMEQEFCPGKFPSEAYGQAATGGRYHRGTGNGVLGTRTGLSFLIRLSGMKA